MSTRNDNPHSNHSHWDQAVKGGIYQVTDEVYTNLTTNSIEKNRFKYGDSLLCTSVDSEANSCTLVPITIITDGFNAHMSQAVISTTSDNKIGVGTTKISSKKTDEIVKAAGENYNRDVSVTLQIR